MAIDNHHSGDGVTLVLFGCGRHADQLAAAGTTAGWRVCTVELPAGPTEPADQIIDFLSRVDSPARAVLVGVGEVGVAAFTVADRHPERVAGVVALAVPVDSAPTPEVCCPTLVLPDGDPADVLPAVGSFLTEVGGRSDGPRSRPSRLPVLTPELVNDPDTLAQLRAAGPVHRVSLVGSTRTWVLTGHEVTMDVLADPRLMGELEITAGFRLSPGANADHRGEQDLVTISADEHARMRRLVAQHLTPRRVDALRPRIQRETDRLLDMIDPYAVTDLIESFARPLPIIVVCDLLGIPESDRDYIYDWLIHRMTEWPPDPHTDVDDYLSRLITTKRARPGDDLISAVVQSEGTGLCVPDLISAARWIMVGGHRAPMTLLANGVAALLREPSQWRRLRDEPDLIGPAVEELLRYITPFPVGLARHVAAPLEIGGRYLAEGSLVAASLVAANRDPARFTDPDTLDLGRAVNPHLAFGYGHHYCIGAALARAEAQIAFGTLARRFPDLGFSPDATGLHYRQSRVRYLLELPIVLGPDRSPPTALSGRSGPGEPVASK